MNSRRAEVPVNAYGEDLAYIHDAGHGDFARRAAPGVLAMLRAAGIDSGLVVDLGCGSGIWAEALCAAGYEVLGIDISEAMVALARRRAPRAEFRAGSFLDADLPPCAAVTALGECFSYLFDAGNTGKGLLGLFRRIHRALAPGGLLIFDVVAPGRVPGPGPLRIFREGEDWAVLVTAEEDSRRKVLTRHITSFRKVGELYRRDAEVHRQRVCDRAELAAQLRGLGFRVRPLAGYGEMRFPPWQIGFLARKA
jgi:SAM-dependent methyltransferase